MGSLGRSVVFTVVVVDLYLGPVLGLLLLLLLATKGDLVRLSPALYRSLFSTSM